MKFGLLGINVGACADPMVARRVARAAEDQGLESVWTAEHVVLPDPQAPPSPLSPRTPLLDPVVALAHLASCTTVLRLGTGIIILPQRNPVVLAKQLASLDVVSGGRLLFGLGLGYIEAEFDAVGASFARRGARAIEYLDAILALWTQTQPAYTGRFVSFAGIQSFPRPAQRPHPPIIVGGATPHAFRRAVAHANGWYGVTLDPAKAAQCIEALRAAEREHGRPAALGRLEISVTPSMRLDADIVKRFVDAGVHRLIVYRRPLSEAEMMDEIRIVGGLVSTAG